MTKMLKPQVIALLLGMVSLSGCAEWESHMRSRLPEPAPMYADKSIVVAPVHTGYAIVFARNAVALSADEKASLSAYLVDANPTKTAIVSVEEAAPRASRTVRQRVASVTDWLSKNGYQAKPAPISPAEDGLVRVMVDKLVAVAPNCPNWDYHKYYEFGANPSPNLGCADRTNLAAMVANPADLVGGVEPSKPMGPAQINGELRYRTGNITPPVDVNASVSD